MLGLDAIGSRPLGSLGDPVIGGGGTTLDLQVAASSSDSHMQSIANDSGRSVSGAGSCVLTSTLLSPGSHGSGDEWSVALRFDSVSIANASTISVATLSLYCDASYSASPNVVKIYISAQASDDAPALSSSGGDLTAANRPRSTATEIFTITTLTQGWVDFDITPVIQEIVDRAGFASGNHVVILIDTHEDTSTAEWQDFRSYDHTASTYAPKLHIETTGGGPTDYPRALSSTLSHSATIARAVALARSSTSSIAHSAAVSAIAGKPRALSTSVSHSATVARSQALARAQSSTISSSASVSRSTSASRPLSSSIAHSASLARAAALARSIASSIAHSASLGRALVLARSLASSIAHSPAVTRAQALLRALSSSIASSASVDRTVTPGGGPTDFPRSLSSTIAHSASLARAAQASRALASSIASSASLSRAQSLARALSSSLAHSASLARLAARSRAMSSTIAHSASLGRLAARARALTSSVLHSASLARAGSFARSLASAIAQTASAVFVVVSSSFVPPTRSRIRPDRTGGDEARRSSSVNRESAHPTRRGSRMRR